MNASECLIDFEAFPRCPDPYYDVNWNDSPWYDFEERYGIARAHRGAALAIIMQQRVLTASEELQALTFGAELEQCRRNGLGDIWFQQRRLQMLAKGVISP